MDNKRSRRILMMARLNKIDNDESSDSSEPENLSSNALYSNVSHSSDPEFVPSDISSDPEQLLNTNRDETDLEPNVEELNVGSNLHEVSSSSDSTDNQNINNEEVEWRNCIGQHLQFNSNYQGGVDPRYAAALVGTNPFTFFRVFIDNEVIDMMVEQTYVYATPTICSEEDVAQYSLLHKWEPTMREDIDRSDRVHGHGMNAFNSALLEYETFISKLSCIMSRNPFETLLQLWHFSDNMKCPPGDIQPLIDLGPVFQSPAKQI